MSHSSSFLAFQLSIKNPEPAFAPTAKKTRFHFQNLFRAKIQKKYFFSQISKTFRTSFLSLSDSHTHTLSLSFSDSHTLYLSLSFQGVQLWNLFTGRMIHLVFVLARYSLFIGRMAKQWKLLKSRQR